jgi:hypothetical protein
MDHSGEHQFNFDLKRVCSGLLAAARPAWWHLHCQAADAYMPVVSTLVAFPPPGAATATRDALRSSSSCCPMGSCVAPTQMPLIYK